MQELFASESLPDDLRYLAIITVKNTLDRGWVKNITSLGENAIQQKDAEKKHIRARMLSMFSISNIKVLTRAFAFRFMNHFGCAIRCFSLSLH